MALASSLAARAQTPPAAAPAAAPAPKKEEAKPKPKWDTSAFLGMTLTRGNSDTVLLNASIASARKWDQNEVTLGVEGSYGENNSVKNADTVHAFGQYNRLFGAKAFGYVRAEGLHDAIADLEYRLTFSPGAGYYFIKNANTTLSAEVGPGYVVEKLGASTESYATLRVGEKLTQKLNERVRLWQSVEFLPQLDDFTNFLLAAEVGVETGLTEKLSLRVLAQDNYRNQPATGREKNDLRLVTGISYKF
jgi:putative salt-induced outer membrane protein YdiY